MHISDLTQPAYRHCWPVELRCNACDNTMAVYDVADTSVGAREYETAEGDPADKCSECGSPDLTEETDLPDYDPHSRCD